MNPKQTRVALATLGAMAAYTGVWALVAPHSFVTRFPGLGPTWVGTRGTVDEHLVRDVGAFYLALAVGGLAALRSPTPAVVLPLGLAWTTFGALHLGYHLGHLGDLAPVARIGTVASLTLMLGLGAALLVPGRVGGRPRGSLDEEARR